MSFSKPYRIHPLPRIEVVVTARSSMKVFTGGCHTHCLNERPLYSTSSDLTVMFTATAKRMTEMVQPVVVMPFSSRCQPDVFDLDKIVILKLT